MIFQEGNTVKLVHTGEIGEIVRIMDSETVVVLLDGDEIPVDIENVVLWKGNAVHDPFQNKKKTAAPAPKVVINPVKPLKNHTNKGVTAVFEPIFDGKGEIVHFDIFLSNDSPYQILFTFKGKLLSQTLPEKTDLLQPFTAQKVGELSHYNLSDNPSYVFDLCQITTDGVGEKMERNVKVKPKPFLSRVKNVSFTATPCYVYDLTQSLTGALPPEDLKAYTERSLAEQEKEQFYQNYVRVHKVSKIEDRANFPDEIDLHIEQLTVNSKGMDAGQILHLQLQIFEEYLDQAIRLGLPKVYVIHGLGKGRLRDDIHRLLKRNRYVKMFNNQFHHKYGFGATEVYLD